LHGIKHIVPQNNTDYCKWSLTSKSGLKPFSSPSKLFIFHLIRALKRLIRDELIFSFQQNLTGIYRCLSSLNPFRLISLKISCRSDDMKDPRLLAVHFRYFCRSVLKLDSYREPHQLGMVVELRVQYYREKF